MGGVFLQEIISYNYWEQWKSAVIQLVILISIIALIVLAIRALSRRSKRMDRLTTNIFIIIVILLGLWLAIEILGVNAFYLVPRLIEWTTMFILPWVVLYWLVKLVKIQERR